MMMKRCLSGSKKETTGVEVDDINLPYTQTWRIMPRTPPPPKKKRIMPRQTQGPGVNPKNCFSPYAYLFAPCASKKLLKSWA